VQNTGSLVLVTPSPPPSLPECTLNGDIIHGLMELPGQFYGQKSMHPFDIPCPQPTHSVRSGLYHFTMLTPIIFVPLTGIKLETTSDTSKIKIKTI